MFNFTKQHSSGGLRLDIGATETHDNEEMPETEEDE